MIILKQIIFFFFLLKLVPLGLKQEDSKWKYKDTIT